MVMAFNNNYQRKWMTVKTTIKNKQQNPNARIFEKGKQNKSKTKQNNIQKYPDMKWLNTQTRRGKSIQNSLHVNPIETRPPPLPTSAHLLRQHPSFSR